MESYELGKNASFEETESLNNIESSDNNEAADLGEFKEISDISDDSVISDYESLSENTADPEEFENLNSDIDEEIKIQSVSEELKESKEEESPESEEELTKSSNQNSIEKDEDQVSKSPMEPSSKKKPGRTKKTVSDEKTSPDTEGISDNDSIAQTVAINHVSTMESAVEEEKPDAGDIKESKSSDEGMVLSTTEELSGDDDEVSEESDTEFTDLGDHDYSTYSKVQLISTLRKMISEIPAEEIRTKVEAIKASYYKLRNAEIQQLKQAFIAEGNEDEVFEPEPDPLEFELKELLKEYKNLRAEVNKKQDVVKEENYRKKSAIIDEIKSLINREESLNVTFQEFNDLQERWRKIGQVPQNRVKDLWENYHYHVELFYDYVKINRELRDLDLKRNMDLKQELCKKAEDLSLSNSDVISLFRELQKLHESWREIGPVPRENKQELWDRFKTATSSINKRYQQYFEQERALQKELLQKKIDLCEKAEEYTGFESDNPRDWNDVTDKILALQDEWKKSGFGPRKENAKIWERFRVANDAFFRNKRNFWNKSKEQLNKNLALKIEICEQAEILKDSDDWKATTDKLITLQKKWKEVGPVPRKQSELIWKRFRTSCDEFFSRKTQHFSGVTGDQDENYKAKKDLLTEIESFKPTGDTKESLEMLKRFQDRWSEIGFVPFRKKEEIQSRYHRLIEAQFNKLKLDDQDVMLYKFKSKIEHWASLPGGWGKINSERDRCLQHLKQLEGDMNTLANNVGFFGSSKGAQSLIQGVNAQIDKIKSQIDYLKAKIKIIDEQDEN